MSCTTCGSPTCDLSTGEFNFQQLQREVRHWQNHNFPHHGPTNKLLVLVEEVGELARAHHRGEKGQRGGEEVQEAQAKLEVGDVLISLVGYCEARGWDLQQLVEARWAKVKQRDWVKDPENGGR